MRNRLTPSLTPHGRLTLVASDDAPELDERRARQIESAFAGGAGHGVLRLGASEVGSVLPPVFGYFRDFGARYVTAVCTRPVGEEQAEFLSPEPPPAAELEALAA